MNRIEAKQMDDKIRERLKHYCQTHNLNPAAADIIMDNYLEIIPDSPKRDMIFLGKDSSSYKAGNARLNMKNVLIALADFVVALDSPDNEFEYLKLALLSALCIGAATKKSLNRNSEIVVYALHKCSSYKHGLIPPQLKEEVNALLKEYQIEDFKMDEFDKTISDLKNWKIIREDNGKLSLNEIVWGKIRP